MSRRSVIDRYHFRGAQKPPVVASRQGIWCSKDTSSAGSPTIQSGSGGAMELTLDNTNEVQNLCLYMGDVLPYDIDDLVWVEGIIKCSDSLNAAIMLAFGLCSARNDTLDSLAANAMFRVEGNNNVLVETDDGTNDNDDTATGLTLGDAYKRFKIDFATGVKTQSAPSLSLGGTANVQFFFGNANGSLRRVCQNTAFDMSNYTGNLQLFAQLQKTAAAAVATLSILEFSVCHKLAA